MDRTVYWHMPGFCVNFYLHQILFNLMKEYPEKFREGYKIGSVYGTFPGALWNGGRTVLGSMKVSQIKAVIDTYNKLDIPVRFTWTNSLIVNEHLDDAYCNSIMDMANNGMNQVLVNSKTLEDYLRGKYPDFKYISSTTKRITGLEEFKKELTEDYFMAVLDYDLNHDEAVLKELEPEASRVEILVDEVCFPHCPKRSEHYRAESMQQIRGEYGKPFECPNIKKKPSFKEAMKRPSFISNEEIGSYIDRGYVNFKIVGRGLPKEMVLDSYLYYLVKDEDREFIGKKIVQTMAKIFK